jgi:D-beta-D-heptose 7-phosphate kinase/D-beta-D-heptose 1-phosphate adenosyltransferase
MNEQTTQQQKQFKILLIGDNCRDIYQYGTVDRISPEAPVPVFVPFEKVERDGMAGNVYSNLVNLGCSVNLVCGHASKKTRLVDIRSKQQLLRIDEDEKSIPIVKVDPAGYDAIVISDYNKGVVTYELVESLLQKSTVPIFIDTKKKDLKRFNGCYVKINELEYNTANSHASDSWLITTYGKFGAMYKGEMIPAPDVGDVTDVCGAGDTFLAALTYKFLETNDIRTAIGFANKASSITVQHFGNYAPKLEEIK